MSRANNHGPEPCACAEKAGASWSLTTTSTKLGQYGNVVRRGVIPLVTGWCVGVMAWSPPAKKPSRKSAVGRGGQNRPQCSYDDGSRNAWIWSGARIRPLKESYINSSLLLLTIYIKIIIKELKIQVEVTLLSTEQNSPMSIRVVCELLLMYINSISYLIVT